MYCLRKGAKYSRLNFVEDVMPPRGSKMLLLESFARLFLIKTGVPSMHRTGSGHYKMRFSIKEPVLYCTVLYCIVLYCIVLYCIVLYVYLMLVFTIVDVH